MALIDLYPVLKPAHVTLVATSGTLFAARGLGVLAGARWPLRPAWRLGSMAIDTLLLTAGLMLWTALHLDPMGNSPWLGVKLLLLPVYVGLGLVALNPARRPERRAAALLGALATLLFMASVAVRHHPLGLLSH